MRALLADRNVNIEQTCGKVERKRMAVKRLSWNGSPILNNKKEEAVAPSLFLSSSASHWQYPAESRENPLISGLLLSALPPLLASKMWHGKSLGSPAISSLFLLFRSVPASL